MPVGTVQALLREWVQQQPLDERVQMVMHRLSENPAESLAHLAAHVGLSVSRLQHVFRTETNRSIGAYRDRVRLRRAAHLLDATDYPIGLLLNNAATMTHFILADDLLNIGRLIRRLGDVVMASSMNKRI